ncbi:MAG TPA: YbaK/EbsC family protein [Candidatus Baltobacteraceae bacterium]|nr:YbaK/EbsC family protein [Candidatus Baltobacteraceae bacterium]
MTIGTVRAEPALARADLLGEPVRAALEAAPPLAAETSVAEIDPQLADTAAFCERYGVRLDESANCVVLAARREGRAWYVACMILATARVDVNGVVKKHLGASKLSFASMDDATAATGMEYGGITPIGLPPEWPLLVDSAVVATARVVVGSGVRRSKLALPGAALATLPSAQTLTIALAR